MDVFDKYMLSVSPVYPEWSFYVKACLMCLQELSYFNVFITGKRLTWLIRKLMININSDCQYLEMYILQVLFAFRELTLKVLFTDSFAR